MAHRSIVWLSTRLTRALRIQEHVHQLDIEFPLYARVLVQDPVLDLKAHTPGGAAVVRVEQGAGQLLVMPPGALPSLRPNEFLDELRAGCRCALCVEYPP